MRLEVVKQDGFNSADHLLAKRLAPVSSDDPAALAFAGLRPEDTPPDEKAEPALEAEIARVDTAVTAIVDELERRLEELELPREELLRFVSHRFAEVVTDPGWIEIHFPMEEVSTHLRKAALDLDPGHVPWLGVVMKFVYE